MPGSRLISVPKAATVIRRSASISRLNGITGSSRASPNPKKRHRPRQLPEGGRADHYRRDQTGHRHRDRQRLHTVQRIAGALGQQDVERPTGCGGQGEQHADRIDFAVPGLGQQHHPGGGDQGPHPSDRIVHARSRW